MRPALCVPRRVGQLREFGEVSEESKMGRGGSSGWGGLLHAIEPSDWTVVGGVYENDGTDTSSAARWR